MPHIQTIIIVTDPRGGAATSAEADANQQDDATLMESEQKWQVEDELMHRIERMLHKNSGAHQDE